MDTQKAVQMFSLLNIIKFSLTIAQQQMVSIAITLKKVFEFQSITE